MLLKLLLAPALLLLLVSLLNVVQAPAWSPWRLGVLSGEFGHWLALAALGVAGLAAMRGVAPAVPEQGGALALRWMTCGLALVAAGLFAVPAFQAWRIGQALPERVRALFVGKIPTTRALPERSAFSLTGLFGGDPEPVPVETLTVAPGLPLDFYRAVRSDGRAAPCVIVVHGGGWDSGDRTQLPGLNHWLARRGYAVAAISYRLAPAHRWPAQRDDVLQAIAFLKTRASALGVDATRLVLLGRSAGGQIAQTVGYTAGDPVLRGVIGLYSPSDLIFGYVNTTEDDMLRSPALMRQYLGGSPETARAAYESASALYHVTPRVPPTLLLHGRNDALVWYRHSERLEAKLREAGVPCLHVALPWATHAFEYNLHGPGGQLTTYALEGFLAAVAGGERR